MDFISELVLHARSADNGDWHGIITGFHVVNQNMRKNIKRGTEGFSLFCFFFLVLALLFFGELCSSNTTVEKRIKKRVTESCCAKSIPGVQRSTNNKPLSQLYFF